MPAWMNQSPVPSSSRRYVLTVIVVFISLFFLYSSVLLFADRHNYRIFFSPLQYKEKVVIWWNPFFSSRQDLPLTLAGLGCKFDKCRFTSNRTLASKSDAIIFHWRDLNPEDLPPKDQSWTKWVLYNYESPPHTPWKVLEPVISRINWVATYRHDSDIVSPYGLIRRQEQTDINLSASIDLSPKIFQEKKSVAWLVSNCHTASRRERYVNELKKHIAVDIYGRCGSPLKNCVKKSRENCYGELAKMYKFYLSFENSIYLDYVTEKAFIPLAVGMVPIVLGGANYSNVLPPNSFINVMDFHTPKDLADYLKTVENNFTLYQAYHEWLKDHVIVHSNLRNYWLCDLCELLHQGDYSDSNKEVKNSKTFHDWWFTKDLLSEVKLKISF